MKKRLLAALVSASIFAACGGAEAPAFPVPDEDYSHLGLSDAEAAGLLSLEQIDDYPLYTMHHYAEYDYEEYDALSAVPSETAMPWGCSLFAALSDSASRIFGRNFDWEFSPALLLFAHPGEGYTSVAMVDIAYLGFAGDLSQNLTARPIEDLVGLLDAPYIPFDGLNEAGLVIGMAAVAPGNMPVDPEKETIGSLGAIRVMLDKAATVEEALDILLGYNIDFEGGPPVHYLIADATGDSVLVEYYDGQVHVFESTTKWHQATNFLRAAVDSPQGQCSRYDTIAAELEATQGDLDVDGALQLLATVAQGHTQWSVVYNASSGQLKVVMGKDFDRVYPFSLEMAP